MTHLSSLAWSRRLLLTLLSFDSTESSPFELHKLIATHQFLQVRALDTASRILAAMLLIPFSAIFPSSPNPTQCTPVFSNPQPWKPAQELSTDARRPCLERLLNQAISATIEGFTSRGGSVADLGTEARLRRMSEVPLGLESSIPRQIETSLVGKTSPSAFLSAISVGTRCDIYRPPRGVAPHRRVCLNCQKDGPSIPIAPPCGCDPFFTPTNSTTYRQRERRQHSSKPASEPTSYLRAAVTPRIMFKGATSGSYPRISERVSGWKSLKRMFA